MHTIETRDRERTTEKEKKLLAGRTGKWGTHRCAVLALLTQLAIAGTRHSATLQMFFSADDALKAGRGGGGGGGGGGGWS